MREACKQCWGEYWALYCGLPGWRMSRHFSMCSRGSRLTQVKQPCPDPLRRWYCRRGCRPLHERLGICCNYSVNNIELCHSNLVAAALGWGDLCEHSAL